MRCKIHIWIVNADRQTILMIEKLALYPQPIAAIAILQINTLAGIIVVREWSDVVYTKNLQLLLNINKILDYHIVHCFRVPIYA